ncbi:peroxisome assembly protein (Peroxin-2) [Orbilia brochopaga]|uniref:RING-type E3 ubiquitin transferase (cysteine targeting) n=1 Tax=Orbilia brochopaga TaxID=3140254 RepID=A0AAV9TYE0_9PEZI
MNPTATAPNISWVEAQRRAQARIADLAVQRAQEAKSSTAVSRLLGLSSLNDMAARGANFRVGQLDTELLDAELLELLKGQLWSAIKYFNPSVKEHYEIEFVALLRFILFKLTIWDNNATYGAALQNLAFADARRNDAIDTPPSRTQKTLYGLVTVLGRYIYDKLDSHILQNASAGLDFDESPFYRNLSRAMNNLTTVHSIASFVSLLTFLSNGRYRTLLDRVLRMKLVTPTRHVRREVSFEYLNRQLVWHAFTEFLLFILPIVGIARWRRWLGKLWRKAVVLIRRSRGVDEDSITTETANNGVLGFLPERTCAICYSESSPEDVLNNPGGGGGAASSNDVTNPYETVECGHVYCYVCIASKIELEEGEGWSCLRCNAVVKRCRPWRAGVVGLSMFEGEKDGVTNSDNGELTLLSPREEHGLDDILEHVEDDYDEDDDPINEALPEVVYAGGAVDEEDEDSDDTRTERGGRDAGYYMKGVVEDDSNYATADDGEIDELEVRPWEQ